MTSAAETELFSELNRLEPDAFVEWDHGHGLFAVWTAGEIIGSAECRSEAIQEAITTIRGWEYN